MLAITENAKEHLNQLLTEAEAPQEKCIRLAKKGDHLAMEFDAQSQDDTEYQHEGRTVLVINEQLAQDLDGRSIDVQDQESGTTLVIK